MASAQLLLDHLAMSTSQVPCIAYEACSWRMSTAMRPVSTCLELVLGPGEPDAMSLEYSSVVSGDCGAITELGATAFLVEQLEQGRFQANSTVCCRCLEQLSSSVCSVGDGDCGATMKRGAMAYLEQLSEGRFQAPSPAALATACGAAARCMGGSSGALYNILFTAAAGGLAVHDASVCGVGAWRAVVGKAELLHRRLVTAYNLAVQGHQQESTGTCGPMGSCYVFTASLYGKLPDCCLPVARQLCLAGHSVPGTCAGIIAWQQVQ